MTGSNTVADAHEYWRSYYAEQFRFGLGTEDILAALTQIPPVNSWVDLGSGSESLLWAIALRARRLVAVDADPDRLAILRRFAAAERPRGVHTTALGLCGRTEPRAFADRCRSLTRVLHAGCLGHELPNDPHLKPFSFDLVTQFGLLGLCRDRDHFTTAFARLHRLAVPGGWVAGANWVARSLDGRVDLSAALYRAAADRAGVQLQFLRRIASSDPDFPAVWTYTGQKTTTPGRTPS